MQPSRPEPWLGSFFTASTALLAIVDPELRYVRVNRGLADVNGVPAEKEGVETIQELRRRQPKVKIIAMSGGGRNAPGSYLNLAKHSARRKRSQSRFRWGSFWRR